MLSGGWEGHQPERTTARFAAALGRRGFEVDVREDLGALEEPALLGQADLIVMNWTMGTLSPDQSRCLRAAVEAGAGLGGWHGGLADAFRADTAYQFMVGGQFVAHPGDRVTYTVVPEPGHPLAEGLPEFELTSEQYYLHVDPNNEVIATTTFAGEGAPWVAGHRMPVAWTRQHGQGRVFYCSVGHDDATFDACPAARDLVERGLAWAAR